jgi:ABC-type lipoprotein export system ATPase subunit
MTGFSGNWNYPVELPVVEHREEILAALKAHQVIVVVSDTGSGKTTLLPKNSPCRLADSTVVRRDSDLFSTSVNCHDHRIHFRPPGLIA